MMKVEKNKSPDGLEFYTLQVRPDLYFGAHCSDPDALMTLRVQVKTNDQLTPEERSAACALIDDVTASGNDMEAVPLPVVDSIDVPISIDSEHDE